MGSEMCIRDSLTEHGLAHQPGQRMAPYPPGVPVVAPGEVISKKELAYFRQIGYNVKSEVRVITSV